MSLAVWHILILWTTLISCSIMSEARLPYVSEFEYVPGLHPSRNPDCPSRFIGKKEIQEDSKGWNRPSIEIRAVLSRCSKGSSDFNRQRGYMEDQGITNCTRKIVINMRFNNIGKTETEEKFIVIDHVLDPTSMKKIPLQNPYVIKVRQEAVLQLYGLKFQSAQISKVSLNVLSVVGRDTSRVAGEIMRASLLIVQTLNKVVNAEAREEVINNEDPSYTGCNVDYDNPTCGQSFMHGEPVPFSQGFCCSCDPKINAVRQFAGSNDTQETSGAASKYNVANKPRNRLPKRDPMAERQNAKNEARSMKKSNWRFANSDASRTGTGASGLNARREEESIERFPSMSLRGHEGENNRVSGKKEAAKSRDKHSREQSDAWSTLVSSTGPEVLPGRPPSGDKTTSDSSVACDTPTTRENLFVEISARPGFGGKHGDHGKMVDKGRFNGGRSVSDAERSNSVKEEPKNRRVPVTGNERDNLQFQSIDREMKTEKFLQNREKQEDRSKDSGLQDKWRNSSVQLIRSKDPFPTSKQELKKKRRKKAKTEVQKGESSPGNSASLPKKRNKTFPVASTIDSLPIRPAMHLNEPLKNLSTDVLNSNGSPASQSPRHPDEANLNRVMESTSSRSDIRAKSFNEKHESLEAEYLHPNDKKKKKKKKKNNLSRLEDVGLKLLSETIKIEQNMISNDDCFDAEKKCIKNYTPQKRTLKNLSYRKNHQHRDRRNQNEHEIDAYQSERSHGRADGTFRGERKRRRSSKRRRRRRRTRRRNKRLNDDKEFVSGDQTSAKSVQVYIDNSRSLQGPTNDKSRSSKLLHGGAKLKNSNGNDRDSLDKRIDEKFSRINDVLKEDSMGSKGNDEEARLDKANKKNPHDDTNDGSSLPVNEETGDGGVSDEATQPIVEKDDLKHNLEDDSETNPNLEAENLAKNERIGDQLPENKFKESKSPTENLDFVISPTSSVRSDLSSSENSLNSDRFTPTENTQALIVVDFFKVAPTETVSSTETLKSSNGSTMVEKIGNLGKNIQKAFGLQPKTETTRPTFAITGTTASNETTTISENTTVATTNTGTTRITDQAFRPSIKPFKDAGRQTSGEFHNEVVVDDLTFPGGDNLVTTSATVPVTRRRFDLSMDARRRKRKRTVQGKGSSLQGGFRGHRVARFDRSLRGDNSKCCGGKDPMKFSLEAGNIDLKSEKLGSSSSFLHEQRNYVQLMVNDRNEDEKRKNQRRRASVEVTDSPRINWIHPWFVTTESSEYTVKTKDHVDRVLPSKSLTNFKKNKRIQKESNVSNSPEISGRILPPCVRSKYRRSRRLLSVGSPKNTKNHHQRSTKNPKKFQNDNYVKDEDEDGYESSSKHRKSSKSSSEKSKKRDTGRSAKKRQKNGKNRSKKQLESSLEDSFEDCDYSMPNEQYDVLEERQADDDDSPEESLETDDTVSSVEESGGKMIPELKNNDPYGRLTDNGVPVDFDGLPDDSKTEERQESAKDFEISLTGNIHLESDSNGRPVSISFNGAPEILPKGTIGSGKTNEYVDRSPASSSYVDASNANDANFLSNAFPLPVDPEEADDRSAAIRERNRNAERYRDASRPQKLLRLQKKSVEAIEDADEQEIRSSKGLSGNDEKHDTVERNLKDSGPSSVSKETKVEDKDVPLDPEDLNNEAPSVDENAPQISLDLSNEPEASFLRNEAENTSTSTAETVPGGCYALNTTTQKIDLQEGTTVVEKMAASANTSLLSYQDLNMMEYTDTTEPPANITAPDSYDNVREEILPAEKQQAFGSSAENNESFQDDKQTTEKKNMLAVAEFVKKLEKLVTDSGNSSNRTGHTLVHLKKFIIVPDNRTFWSLGNFSEAEESPETSTTDTVIVMGEGIKENENIDNDKDEEGVDDDFDRRSKLEKADSIKEIISSVIRGDDVKRVVSDEADEFNEESRDQTRGKHETGLNSLIKALETTSTKKEKDSLDAESKNDDRSVERNLQGGENPSNNNNDVCKGDRSKVKEKREAGKSNVELIKRERKQEAGNKKKDTGRGKKKRRRKRRRKSKKRRKNSKKKSNKKSGGKWPFKRNLLMLSEGEQIQTSDCENERRIVDKFSSCGSSGNTMEPMRKPDEEDRFKEPQTRGGQDCSNHRHPANVDPSKYLESAHCLRFSNLWYSVYQLEEPLTAHKIDLQIYVKRTASDGSMFWQDLTNGSSIRLGTFDRRYRDRGNTMDFTYNDIKLTPSAGYNLDPAKDRLLVPSTLSEDQAKYPEIEGWSGEYLVVGADRINGDANECDKAGVGFAAFVNQPDRCERVRGTCLKNQPMDYWRHDVEARDSGLAGCYFLSNFGRVPSEAIKYNVNGTGSREFLALEYHSPHVSVIDVELRPDYNALLRAGSYGRLTEVYIDNTAIDYTVITVLITNKGSSSSSYRARITDCPEGLPVSWLNAETPAKTISSRRDRKVALDLYGSLSLNEFSCSVELLNSNGEPVATRRIKVRRMDRCYCIRHCTCACSSERTRCQPMTLENYHAAGFRGPLPPAPDEPSIWFNVITVVCLVIIGLLLLLLLLGVLKWMIGICLPAVSRWGLDSLLETNKMKEYFEKDLKSRTVVFNEFGQPVHPDTRRKSVRVCNRKLEFFLNLIFFFIHPLVVCCWHCMKPEYPSKSTLLVESKASLMSEKDESPTMICVGTYGDSINSKMEAEDTKYVIDELKKSQESLQNRSRYKMDTETSETVLSSSD